MKYHGRNNPNRDYKEVYDEKLTISEAVIEAKLRHGLNTPKFFDFLNGWKTNKKKVGGTAFGNGHGKRSKVRFINSAIKGGK